MYCPVFGIIDTNDHYCNQLKIIPMNGGSGFLLASFMWFLTKCQAPYDVNKMC